MRIFFFEAFCITLAVTKPFTPLGCFKALGSSFQFPTSASVKKVVKKDPTGITRPNPGKALHLIKESRSSSQLSRESIKKSNTTKRYLNKYVPTCFQDATSIIYLPQIVHHISNFSTTTLWQFHIVMEHQIKCLEPKRCKFLIV